MVIRVCIIYDKIIIYMSAYVLVNKNEYDNDNHYNSIKICKVQLCSRVWTPMTRTLHCIELVIIKGRKACIHGRAKFCIREPGDYCVTAVENPL